MKSKPNKFILPCTSFIIGWDFAVRMNADSWIDYVVYILAGGIFLHFIILITSMAIILMALGRLSFGMEKKFENDLLSYLSITIALTLAIARGWASIIPGL